MRQLDVRVSYNIVQMEKRLRFLAVEVVDENAIGLRINPFEEDKGWEDLSEPDSATLLLGSLKCWDVFLEQWGGAAS